jgi:hypothetical protein
VKAVRTISGARTASWTFGRFGQAELGQLAAKEGLADLENSRTGARTDQEASCGDKTA